MSIPHLASAALPLRNGDAAPLDRVPVVPMHELRSTALSAVESGSRVLAFFGAAVADRSKLDGAPRVFMVLAAPAIGSLEILSADPGDSFQSLTPVCPQAHLFEREIAETWSIRPEGHPWLKPVRFVKSQRAAKDVWRRKEDTTILPGVADYFEVDGDGIHEVAVGPVHAGVIEPGHFRFQCDGERVLHLEIQLGYQHRGVERGLLGGPNKRSIHYAETLAGDTSVGHATAYVEVVEALARTAAPARAQSIRGIALELERLANHTGDLGALAGDIGYLPTASFCGRIRGDFLNLTALLCGNRFGRGLVRSGGVRFDFEPERATQALERLEPAFRDLSEAVGLLWTTSSVMARFESTGRVSREDCEALGLAGVAARACGVERDARAEFPSGIFRVAQIPPSTWRSGDVFARAYVRSLEIQRSIQFLREELRSLPGGPIRRELKALQPNSIAVGLVEGWRGEICHVAITDSNGRFAAYKIVDPSFRNWPGLAMALRNQQISDFPLVNKSFNLSYCGFDL